MSKKDRPNRLIHFDFTGKKLDVIFGDKNKGNGNTDRTPKNNSCYTDRFNDNT